MSSSDVSSENNMPSRTRKMWLIGFACLFGLIGIVAFCYWLMVARFEVSTDDAYVQGNSVQIMSQIPGFVTTIFADETQAVDKGQKLIILDHADAQIALNNAKAELALTTRKVNQLYTTVKQLRASVELAKDNLEKTNEDLKRRQGLSVNKTISAEELEHTQIAAKSAKDGLYIAEQELQSALNLVGGTDIVHHPQVVQAIVKLRDAYLNWQRTTIYSPITGYVAKRVVQVGEEINTNSVLMIVVPLDKIWIDANFKESQLRDLRIGQSVTVICDAYGSDIKYKGTVIGLSPGTGSTFDLLPPQNATGNWIKIVQRLPVRIQINDEQLQHNPLRIGLSVTVTVDIKDKSGTSLTTVEPAKAIYESVDTDKNLKEVDKLIEEILQANVQNSLSLRMQ